MFYLLPLLAANESCPSFQCGSLDKIICIKAGDPITLQVCEDEQFSYCPFTDFSTDSQCIATPPAPIAVGYPGDPCSSNLTCIYSNCQHGICQGFIPSTPCSDTGQCTAGYRCEYGKCKVLLPIGPSDGEGNDANCTTDYDCVNSGVCDNGNCYNYFSKEETDPVSSCENGVNLACKSGLCYKGFCLSEKMTSLHKPTAPCSSDDDCNSNYYLSPPHKLNFSSGCQCGMNQKRQKYCGMFPGDKTMKKYIEIFKEWMDSSEVKSCHSYSRTNLNCVKHYWSSSKYSTLAYYMYRVNNARVLVDVEDCVKEIVFFGYDKGHDDESSYAAWVSLTLALVLW